MILLKIPAGPSSAAPHIVLVFGVGLIGSSLVSHLQGVPEASGERMAWSWTDAGQRALQANLILQKASPDRAASRLSVVWSAGAGGFNSPPGVLENEFEAFSDALNLTRALADQKDWARATFHLVSSAGGLFEGVRFVGADTLPTGTRGYALSKLRQEEEAEARLPASIGLHVYRPSSVYGYQRGGRVNLVSALVQNGYRHQTTTIFGRTNTLRDFIHVSDVGRKISDEVMHAREGRSCQILASGKPSSMLEVIQTVEAVIGKRLLLKFDTSPSNALDNSFRASVTGPVAERIPLRRGIERTAEAWKWAEFLTLQN